MTTTVADVPEDLVTDFDVYDPGLTMPEDVFQERAAELAAKGPILYSTAQGGHWLVTHYEEVDRILNDPETFSSHPNFIGGGREGRFLPLEVDPPEHTAYRDVLRPLFTPHKMKALELEVREIVGELIDGFIEQGECEFVGAFAHELPTRVFLAMMGLPLSDADLFNGWTMKMLIGDPTGTEEESNAVRQQVTTEIYAYFAKVIDQRRGESAGEGADATSVIINSPASFPDGERMLSDQELQEMFFLVLIAGLHTTQGSLGWGMMHMARNQEARRKLTGDLALLPYAIEEIVRIEAAVSPGRRATKDVELGGMQLKKGDQLVLLLSTANRDSEHFASPEPNTVSFERRPNRHLSFGSGAHRCIGAHLARVELRIAFEELLKRIPDYELTHPPLFHPSQTRGVLAMPIKFTAGAKRG